jgi:hypothetical protein
MATRRRRGWQLRCREARDVAPPLGGVATAALRRRAAVCCS